MSASDSSGEASQQPAIPGGLICCDIEALKALSKGLPAEDAREFEKLALESFIRFTPSTLERMERARTEGRHEDAWRHAHSLRAAGKMFGSTKLVRAIKGYQVALLNPEEALVECEKELCLAHAELMKAVRKLHAAHLEQD